MTKRSGFAVAGVLVLLFLAGTVQAQEVSLEAEQERVAKETMPEGAVEATKPVWGKFAESASPDKSGSGVVLYKNPADSNSYEGKVLVPEGFEIWNRYALPKPQNVWSMMSPIAIFFANADGDSDTEMLIIDECYTGIGPTGAQPFYRTRVYDFNGISFEHRDELSEMIGNLNTAAKVRAKLRQMGGSIRSFKTPMFERIDIGGLNQQIFDGGKAGAPWVKDPYQIAVKLAGVFEETQKRTIEMSVPKIEGSSTMTITITDDGIADDSTRSMRYRIELAQDEGGIWNLITAGRSWVCQAGRGSQTFTTVRCL